MPPTLTAAAFAPLFGGFYFKPYMYSIDQEWPFAF